MATAEKYTDQQIVDGLNETAKTVNRLMLTLLALGLFSLLSIGLPDAYLLTPAATVSVPSVGATSAKALLIVGPLLLIGARVYLQIYVEHWRDLDEIARARNIMRAAIVSPMRHPMLRWLAGAVFYLLVPVALAAFTWKAIAIPKWWGYGLLIVTVFVLAAHLLQDWRLKWTVRLGICAIIAGVIGVIGRCVFMQDLHRPLDLRFAELNLTNLAGMDLRKADLRQAKLNGADLRRAKLQGADLTRAMLERADLRWAQLQRAILIEAELQRADLTGAQLKNANLILAQLQKANLSDAQLQGADLEEAQLQGADLEAANLKWAGLEDAQLKDANLHEAKLQGADLTGAQLQGAELSGANLQSTTLTLTNFSYAKGLTPNSLDSACYHPKTGDKADDKYLGPPIGLPDGITIPPCKKANEKNPDRRPVSP